RHADGAAVVGRVRRRLPAAALRGTVRFFGGPPGPPQRMIMKNLYVGNLPFSTTEDDLRQEFSKHGTVTSTQIVKDRETGRSRGFGFVEMSDGADAAGAALN